MARIYKIRLNKKANVFHFRNYGANPKQTLCGLTYNIDSNVQSPYKEDKRWSPEHCCRSCQKMRILMELGE